MIKNQINGKTYEVIGVKEQEDNSFLVALDPVEGLKSTAMGCVMSDTPLQAMSNKYWNQEELLNEFLHWQSGGL